MKVIMTGGGTGGHIYPAIAIADYIKVQNPDAEILFVGTQKGLESQLVPSSGYPIKTIIVSGFNRSNLLANFKTIIHLIKGINQSKKIINEFQPDVVIGTGGYVCGPLVYAAAKKKVPCFIQEQNAFPGLTNKMLEKHVKKIFVSFDQSKAYFKNEEKLILSGNPLRKEFISYDLSESKEKININSDVFNILYFGGSRGSETLNNALIDVVKSIKAEDAIKLYFVTGEIHYDAVKQSLGDYDEKKIAVLPYLHNISDYMIGCDLIISRAGAIAVSEIAALGKPSILIPSPYVTNNHQHFNAKALSDESAAFLIEEKDMSGKIIKSHIDQLRTNSKTYNEMATNSKNQSNTKALEIIYKEILKWGNKNGSKENKK